VTLPVRNFLPGPTEVRPAVLAAMTQPIIGHRSAAFAALHARVTHGLQSVFRTQRPVYTVTASATGMMEMAIRGTPSGAILSLVNGAFADRFAQIAEQCGRSVTRVDIPWGSVPTVELIEPYLASAPYVAMTLVHSETSTGALTDVRSLTSLAHQYGVSALVDSVTGIGADPVESDAWEIDFIFTGSQKALAIPPGLAFGVASAAYIARAETVPHRGRYLDPITYEAAAARGGTPTTPAISLLYAADAQLTQIHAEGIEARWARHAAMRAAVEHWVADRNRGGCDISLSAPAPHRSPSVSCVTLPPGRDAAQVVRAMAERGFSIGEGYGRWQSSTIRIGHMGDHTVAGLDTCLGALAEVLQR
jgi:aspartate aminotransferase-like enzyme